MKSTELLTEEHRLIERMIDAVKGEIVAIRKTRKIDPVFIETTVDFIETYADLTHHGKEEGIVFSELAKKTMTIIDTEVMQSLIDDHVRARKNATELRSLNADYRAGNQAGAGRILALLTEFITFYPPHMEKEEKEFFVSLLALPHEKGGRGDGGRVHRV